MTKRFLMAVCFVGLAAAPAGAQTLKWDQTFIGGVNVGAQASSARTETTAFNFSLYGETATVTNVREVPSGILFDAFAAARIRGNFGAAGIVIQRNGNSDGAVTASIPSPVFFDQPRAVTATITDMRHRERWAGLYGAYMIKLDKKTGILVMGGPMIAAVDHSLPTAATVAEGTTPTVTVAVTEFSKTVWGYGAAADFSYMMTPNVGFGAQARYIGAKANLTSDASVKVGGFQVSAGVRISFSSK
jgi:hypothetical protein